MADAFIDIRELDVNTLRDISVKSGVIWPEDGDRESRLFRFRVRRIATEAYRRGVADGQKINTYKSVPRLERKTTTASHASACVTNGTTTMNATDVTHNALNSADAVGGRLG